MLFCKDTINNTALVNAGIGSVKNQPPSLMLHLQLSQTQQHCHILHYTTHGIAASDNKPSK